ncbi:MAG: porin family protein [Bacteroidota bacterium]
MLDRHEVEWIKMKLANLELPLQEEDWDVMSKQLDAADFDQELRGKFSAFTLPLDSNTWEEMVDQLDQHDFDQMMQAKLTGMEMPVETDAWHEFEEQYLDPQPSKARAAISAQVRNLHAPLMDKIIRQKFNGFELSPLRNDWLDMLELLEKGFDRNVKYTLYNHSVKGVRSDWRKMSLLLDQVGGPVIRFPYMRVAAAAMIFFAILIGGNYWMSSNGYRNPLMALVSPADSLHQQTSNAANSPAFATNHSRHKTSEQLSTEDNQQLIHSDTVQDQQFEGQHLSPKGPDMVLAAMDASETMSIQLAGQEFSTSRPSFASHKEQKTVEENNLLEVLQAVEKRKSNISISKMGVLAMNDYWEVDGEQKSWVPITGKIKREIWIGGYVGTTSTKAELNGSSDKVGFAAGVKSQIKFNENWSLVTGLNYNTENFLHQYKELTPEGDGFINKAYQGTITSLDLPIMARYQFASENDLRLYIQAGVAPSISLSEDYLEYDPTAAGLVSRNPSLPLNNEPVSYFQQLNTYPGNIQLSFGFSYPVNENLKVELEPYFIQNLQATAGTEGLGVPKRLYTAGVGLNFFYKATQSGKK